jgi:hypothetical protein
MARSCRVPFRMEITQRLVFWCMQRGRHPDTVLCSSGSYLLT